jgi:hypothetical protein
MYHFFLGHEGGLRIIVLRRKKSGKNPYKKKHAHTTRILKKQKRPLQEFNKQNYYVMGKFKDYIQQLDCNCLYQTPSVQVKPNAT